MKKPIAIRMNSIEPFHVMALLARARELEANDIDVIHMEIGEPELVTPEPVIKAGIQALQQGKTHYTPATGLEALRKAISDHYRKVYATRVDPRRIIITPGASGALQLVLALLVDPGKRVLLADPGYPCNRNFVLLFNGVPVPVPVGPEQHYQLTAELVSAYWSAKTCCAMVASPSNPTGTLLPVEELAKLVAQVNYRGGHLIVDEIYQGLNYGSKPQTVLSMADDVFVINSFSKFFGMTGWRLGWLVAPSEYVNDLDKLAQNLFLSAPTPAQYAALTAFSEENLTLLEQRRKEFQRRRDYFQPALQALGFDIPVEPSGAFYLYANCSRFCDDSFTFANDLLESAAVAITPGIDFGAHRANEHVRFAYTASLDRLKEGVSRIEKYIQKSSAKPVVDVS